jgi:hypothetical protein
MKKYTNGEKFIVPVHFGQMMMLSKTPTPNGGGIVGHPTKSNLATPSFSPKTSLLQDSNVVIPAVINLLITLIA